MSSENISADAKGEDPLDRKALSQRVVWYVVLLAVLLTGSVVRVVGLAHGRPQYIWHPDVSKQAQIAIEAYSQTPNPKTFFNQDVRRALYPYGSSILLARTMRIWSALGGREAVEKKDRWLWDYRLRGQASILFLFAVAVSNLCLRPRLGTRALLLSGLVLVFEPAGALDSHYGMNDVPMTALVFIAWALCSRIPHEPLRFPWASLFAGLALGLAFGVKYTAALAGIFPLAVWISLIKEHRWKPALISFAAMVILGLAGMWLTCPMLQKNPAYFWQNLPAFMQWQANVTRQVIPLAEKIPANLIVLIRAITGRGHFLLLLGGILGTILIWRNPNLMHLRGLSAAIWILEGLLIIIILTGRDVARANDILMLWPPMIMSAAIGLSAAKLSQRLMRPVVVLTVLTIGWFGTTAMLDAAALSRPDTRERARNWCLEQVPAESILVRERYTLPVRKPGVHEFEVRYLYTREDILDGKPDYVISSSMAYGRFFDPGMPYCNPDVQFFYRSIINHYEVVAEFHDRELPFANPRITVYRKQSAAGESLRGEIHE